MSFLFSCCVEKVFIECDNDRADRCSVRGVTALQWSCRGLGCVPVSEVGVMQGGSVHSS